MSAGDPLKVCLDGGARDDLILGPSNAKLGSTFRAQVGGYPGGHYPFCTAPANSWGCVHEPISRCSIPLPMICPCGPLKEAPFREH